MSSAEQIGRSPNGHLAAAGRRPLPDLYDLVQGRENRAVICRCQKTGIGGKIGRSSDDCHSIVPWPLDAVCLLLGKRCRAQQKTPCAFCSGVISAWCHLLRKSDVWPVDPLTRWPFKKRSPQGQFRGPTTYTHQVWWRSIKGPRRSRGTNKQTDRQTNAARIIVWFQDTL